MFFNFFKCISLQVDGTAAPFFAKIFATNRCTVSAKQQIRHIVVNEQREVVPDGIFLSRTAAFHNDKLFLADAKGNWSSFVLNSEETMFQVRYQSSFDYMKLSKIVEWGMHIMTSYDGLAFVHSMGYGTSNGAIICPAWLNTGKTKTFIRLLMAGNTYIGDDWSVVNREGNVWAYPKVPFLYVGDLRELYSIVTSHLRQSEKFVIYMDGKLTSKSGKRLQSFIMHLANVSFPVMLPVSELAESIPSSATLLYRLLYLTRGNEMQFSLRALPKDVWLPRIMHVYRYEHGLFVPPTVFNYAFPGRGTLEAHYERVTQILNKLDWSRAHLLHIPQKATSLDIEAFLRQEGLCE